MSSPTASGSKATPAVLAVKYLAEHGYDETTAGALADAVGMSRSTFFRRFGSKDDVIFAEHYLALAHLEDFLSDTHLPVEEVIVRGAADALHQLTHSPDAAQQRSELLRRTPALRERERVISHRYERLFTQYLSRVAPEHTPGWVPVALAAAVVAVHNAALRGWLREPDSRVFGELTNDLRALTRRFAPWFGDEDQGQTRIIVAAFDASASPDAVMRRITEFGTQL